MLQQHMFFQRFGNHGMCVLPDDVLSDDSLIDPETGEDVPSLREQVSLVNGIYHRMFCYAQVLRTCGDGLYWADVAATPDFVNTFRVILTEEDLYFALPYDVRVQGKSPAHILKDTNQSRVSRSIGSFRMQQAFLRIIIDALMKRLYWSPQAQESAQSSRIKTQCAAVASLQRRQRQSRPRYVNALPVWSDEQYAVVWQLTVGDPLALMAAA
jgi:hypothetical protein